MKVVSFWFWSHVARTLIIICGCAQRALVRVKRTEWKLTCGMIRAYYYISVIIIYYTLYSTYTSPLNLSWTPGVFYTYFYNHARRLRLEKLLYLELSRSLNGFFKALLDLGGGFASETAVLICTGPS